MIYAIINSDNIALNFVLWDGLTEFDPGEGMTLVPVPEDTRYGFGWVWNGTEFVPPPEGV